VRWWGCEGSIREITGRRGIGPGEGGKGRVGQNGSGGVERTRVKKERLGGEGGRAKGIRVRGEWKREWGEGSGCAEGGLQNRKALEE